MSNLKTATISAISAIVVAGFSFAGGYWALQQTIEDKLTDHRELDIKMVDVALAILAGEKGSRPENQSVEARRFAVQILRQYSKLDETREDVKLVNWDEWAEAIDKPLQFQKMTGHAYPTKALIDALYGASVSNLSKAERECLRATNDSPHCLVNKDDGFGADGSSPFIMADPSSKTEAGPTIPQN